MPPTDSPPSSPRKSKRRWLRLSLRGMMVLVLLVGGGLGYVIHEARVQRDAVLAIGANRNHSGGGFDQSNGYVEYRWSGSTRVYGTIAGSFPDPPWLVQWLLRWLDRDYFDPVIAVNLGPGAGDAEMAHVARLPYLERFSISSDDVTDAGLLLVGQLPLLEGISVPKLIHYEVVDDKFIPETNPTSRPRATGAFLKGLAGLSRLEHLQLAGLPIHDADLAGISGLTHLEDLDLSETGISDAGMVHLQGLVALQSLALSGNPGITSAGLPHLSHLTTLTSLDLDCTAVRDLGPLTSLPGCYSIKLAGTPITDANLASLNRVTHLIRLDLAGTAIQGSGLATLGNRSGLRIVVLERSKVTDGEVGALVQLPSLCWLNLAATSITDAGLDQLARCPSLEVLDLTRTAVTDAGILRLLGSRPLIGLNLDEDRLTPANRAAFLLVAPTLRFNEHIVR